MSHVLRDSPVQGGPISVPLPGSWDPIAQAAYEQGRADGYQHGHDVGRDLGYRTGRTELDAVAESVLKAAARCAEEVRRFHEDLVERVIELSDLYVRTVVRGAPDASAVAMLARIEESLSHLEPGELELSVDEANVEEITRLVSSREDAPRITVLPGRGLLPGEFRLRTEWAEAEGTWDRYVAAAHEAMTMYLVEQSS